MDLSCPFAFFLQLFCFFDVFFVCFYFAFIVRFVFKKQKKMQNKSKKMQIEKAKKLSNGQVHVFPMFFPFLTFLFPHLFCFRFFSVLKFCFLIFHVFSFFLHVVSSLKILRISYGGEHHGSPHDETIVHGCCKPTNIRGAPPCTF